MPLPLSDKDNDVLGALVTNGGMWLNVIVAETNVYNDDHGNLLTYTADLNDTQLRQKSEKLGPYVAVTRKFPSVCWYNFDNGDLNDEGRLFFLCERPVMGLNQFLPG